MKEAHRAVSPKGLYNARDFAVSRPNVRKARLRGAPHSRLRAKIFAQSIEAVRMMLRNATMSQSEVARSEAKKNAREHFPCPRARCVQPNASVLASCRPRPVPVGPAVRPPFPARRQAQPDGARAPAREPARSSAQDECRGGS